MTEGRRKKTPSEGQVKSGFQLQEAGLHLLLAEVMALQAMIPIGDRELPGEDEIEKGFDNMPV